jgi:hypothetical protein
MDKLHFPIRPLVAFLLGFIIGSLLMYALKIQDLNTNLALGQFFIAVLVAYVAWQNQKINESSFKLNKNNLRLNLFDRRYKIFESFRSFFRDFQIESKIESKKLSEFSLNTTDSEFLFGKEITDYRNEVINKSIQLKSIVLKLERAAISISEREKLASEAEKIEEWLYNQNDNLSKFFRKYLHFTIDSKNK